MKRIYLLVIIFGVLLFFLNREYRNHYEGLRVFFEVGKNLEEKYVFTDNYKQNAALAWSKFDNGKDWENASSMEFLDLLAVCLNEVPSYNVAQDFKIDTLNYVVYVETRKPFLMDFELVRGEKGIQINDIANISELFDYAQQSMLVPPQDKCSFKY